MRHAPTFAGAAEVARPAAVNRLGEIGIARRHNGAAEFFLDAIAAKSFLASERNGRLKMAVGEMLKALGGAGDTDTFFSAIVVGLDVCVAERPGFANTNQSSLPEIPNA